MRTNNLIYVDIHLTPYLSLEFLSVAVTILKNIYLLFAQRVQVQGRYHFVKIYKNATNKNCFYSELGFMLCCFL